MLVSGDLQSLNDNKLESNIKKMYKDYDSETELQPSFTVKVESKSPQDCTCFTHQALLPLKNYFYIDGCSGEKINTSLPSGKMQFSSESMSRNWLVEVQTSSGGN